jgi:hypothetical protein
MVMRMLSIILGMAVILSGMAYAGSQTFANGREVSAKQSNGKSVAAMPDVCNSPPSPPAGPIPIPYPNTAKASDTSKGSKKVKNNGSAVMLKDSNFEKSSGDEAGTKNDVSAQQIEPAGQKVSPNPVEPVSSNDHPAVYLKRTEPPNPNPGN